MRTRHDRRLPHAKHRITAQPRISVQVKRCGELGVSCSLDMCKWLGHML